MPHLIELSFQLIDLANYFSETGDFGVGLGDGGRGPGGLVGYGACGLGCELWRTLVV